MSSKKRFFLVYVSLIALANSVHADGANNDPKNDSIGTVLGDLLRGFRGDNDKNNDAQQGGGFMDLSGFGQQDMMKNSIQPVHYQSIPGMNQGGFNGQLQMPGSPMMSANGQPALNQMAGQSAFFPQTNFQQGINPGAAMAGFSGEQQMPGSPMMSANGQPVIDPATGQPVLVPQPGTMAPGSPMVSANGQPIINPMTGQPVLVPQPAMQQNGMGGVFAGPIDESVLANPALNPQLYAQIMATAQNDPQLVDALARVKEKLNEEDAKLVRATLLKPILLRMHLSQAQEAQRLQAEQMQQQQAMSQASAAAQFAEQQRIRTLEAEISRLEQENNQIIANLKRQGVSQEEINAIISRSRQDGARVGGTPQMAEPMNNSSFDTPPEMNPNAIMPLGAPQTQVSGLPAFPGMGEPQPQAGGLPAFPGIGEPQAAEPQASGLPAFPGIGEPQAAEPQAGGLPQMPF